MSLDGPAYEHFLSQRQPEGPLIIIGFSVGKFRSSNSNRESNILWGLDVGPLKPTHILAVRFGRSSSWHATLRDSRLATDASQVQVGGRKPPTADSSHCVAC